LYLKKKLVIKESETIRRKVYNYVREQVLSGEIKANERLIETKIAEEIGTSRTPVREALHSLEIEGLIESIPRIGYTVKPLNDYEAEEICEIRCVIECLAAKWAMEKAPEKLVKELQKNITVAEERIAEGQLAAFTECDAQFHEIIARLSGSKRLLELAQTLRRHMLRYRLESIYLPDPAIRAIAGHREILKAIEGGDPEKISSAIKFHLEQSKRDTVRYALKGDQKRR
jgi:GntR family transcriptional regulator, rspAB operon transcriptional repressor